MGFNSGFKGLKAESPGPQFGHEARSSPLAIIYI